jgi:hypothetical protein
LPLALRAEGADHSQEQRAFVGSFSVLSGTIQLIGGQTYILVPCLLPGGRGAVRGYLKSSTCWPCARSSRSPSIACNILLITRGNMLLPGAPRVRAPAPRAPPRTTPSAQRTTSAASRARRRLDVHASVVWRQLVRARRPHGAPGAVPRGPTVGPPRSQTTPCLASCCAHPP